MVKTEKFSDHPHISETNCGHLQGGVL